MKHFGLGLLIGSTIGLFASFLKDDKGERVGAPLKKEFLAFKEDVTHLSASLKKAQRASAELRRNMPAAQRAITDINDDVAHYQDHTQRALNQIEHKTKQIEAKVNAEHKKN